MRYVYNPITGELDLVEVSGGSANTIKVSLTKTAANSVEYKGVEIPNVLTWKTMENGSPVVPSSVEISKVEGDGAPQIIENISAPSSNTGTCNAPVFYLGKTTFKAAFVISEQSKTASVSVTTYLPMYIGFDPGTNTPLNDFISSLQTFGRDDLPLIVNNPSSDYKKLVVAVPSGTVVKSVHSDMGFTVPLENAVEDVLTLNGNDHNYNLYRSLYNISPGEMNITDIVFN